MAKNVLVLSSSPGKGGNSDLLYYQFVHGAKEAGNQAEKIFFRDKKINYCTGCDACRGNGGKDVRRDDMAKILDKMMAADVIVMATSVEDSFVFSCFRSMSRNITNEPCPEMLHPPYRHCGSGASPKK